LDRDLGFDSLGRVELLFRLERAFRIRLPEELLGEAQTPRDLLAAVLRAEPSEPLPAGAEQQLPAPTSAEAAPQDIQTLTEVLDWHVEAHPDRPHIVLSRGEAEEQRITYLELAEAARSVACGLRQRGLEPGDRVAIMLPTGAGFFQAFLGAVYCGCVPVPIYPPMRRSQLEEHLRRQARILGNAQAKMLIAGPEARQVSGLLRSQVTSLGSVASVGQLGIAGIGSLPGPMPADSTALIQYTSGSTGHPKGVVLTHGNLLSNIRAMGERVEAVSSDVFVSWLPLYHDMGLIGAWLGSLYYAVPAVIMSPLTFLARPERWLWAVHRHRGTLSAAPNFALELCLHRIEDQAIDGLDLSSLRFVANGAEPVSADTIRRFTSRFASHGFRPEAMAPVYGLAENSVGLAFPRPGRPPIVDRIQRDALADRGEAVPAPEEDPNALEFVACGQPLPNHQIRIVDDTGREVGERHQGRLQFCGPSATRGYFRNETKTRELFAGKWLDSNDLAYIAGGDVFITGRIKDLIIRAGRNIHPQEVEETVGKIEGLRRGCIAAFGSPDPASGTERLVILAETRRKDPKILEDQRRRIVEAALDILETPPDEIVLAPPNTVPKTSSGKIRRAAARELYEGGRIGVRPRALWWQIARLSLAGVLPQARRGARALLDRLYAGYWWAVVGLAAGIAWPLVLLLPHTGWRWALIRHTAKLALRLMGTPLRIEGSLELPPEGGILVANHASYLDGVVLAATLPGEMSFVAKKELAGQFFAGQLLKRIGTLFVERADPGGSVEDTKRALAAVRAGRRLVFFSEGTLTRMPGLMPFHLGAFVIAAQSGAPVLPIALRGTRSILRGEQWFPRPGSVTVTLGNVLLPDGDDFAAAIRLRDAARAQILDNCGEPDLGQ
jgi:1-acyl-sn-glycerol-3-phosphate acyltransferase